MKAGPKPPFASGKQPRVLLVMLTTALIGAVVFVGILYYLTGGPSTAGDSAWGIAAAADGGFYVAGTTELRGAGKRDAWVRRLDREGEVLWERTLGGEGQDWGTDIAEAGEGGCVLAGNDGSSAGARSHAWVVGLDSEGEILWQSSIEHGKLNAARRVRLLPDSILIGGMGGGRAWVATVDAQGKELTSARLAGGKSSSVNDAWAIVDGTVLAGWTNYGSGRVTRIKPRIAHLDQDGKPLWDLTFDWRGALNALRPTSNGFVVAGERNDGEHGGKDGVILALDMEGGVKWSTQHGSEHPDTLLAVFPLGGDWFAVGNRGGPDHAVSGWVMRFDAEMNVLFDRTYGDTGMDHVEAAIPTPDGRIAIAGWKGERGKGEQAWVMLLDASGDVVWDRTYGEQPP